MTKLLFRGPVLTASGYGTHARQLLRALASCKRYDVSVDSVKWGDTSFVPATDSGVQWIVELIAKHDADRRANARYDVSVQVTIPNEFVRCADVNVGVTAGIETDCASPEWIAKCNKEVDAVIVPSSHSSDVLRSSKFIGSDNSVLELTAPTIVVPEGVDTSVYNTEPVADEIELPCERNLLYVGLGFGKSDDGDRKNLAALVSAFCDQFAGRDDVGLVLKSGIVGTSLMDFESFRRRVQATRDRACAGRKPPRITIVHGRLTDAQLARLYKHSRVRAFVTLTHGEGFGLPLIEAAACGLPIVATDWSGHLDFLTVDGKKMFEPVACDLVDVHRDAVWPGVIEAGVKWASPRVDDAKVKMELALEASDQMRERAAALAAHVASAYSLGAVSSRFVDAVGRVVDGRAGHVSRVVASGLLVERFERGKPTLLYTMPLSAGDVIVSTAVVNSLRKLWPNHHIIFATSPQYFELVRGDPDVDEVVEWEGWMGDVPMLEGIFDVVMTPNLALQLVTSNWVRRGTGRSLAQEMARACDVALGEYRVQRDDSVQVPDGAYVVLHPGAGKGQWEARRYAFWDEVAANLRGALAMPTVQVGEADDPPVAGCVDMRGKTSWAQLASVIARARALVAIDTATVHMAAALGTPVTALYGSSYSTSTGPCGEGKAALIDTPDRRTCKRACYKYQCSVDRGDPCINEIDPRTIVERTARMLGVDMTDFKYVELTSKISGYTHVLNAIDHGFPFAESIESMLGFCDEVVVVDGGSTDGTRERLDEMAKLDARLKVHRRDWDWSEPGMDGMQKAFARALCEHPLLWQQDADEVVHEDDYVRVRRVARRMPPDVNVLHLPIVELVGNRTSVRTDRHPWKWRLSRNDFRITHGINKAARVVDQKTGRTHARRGASDGCEYIDIMTGEPMRHHGFYNDRLEELRRSDTQAYGAAMNDVFDKLPCVFHYSWLDLPRKIGNFKRFWNRCWSNLYGDPEPVDRFPDVAIDDGQAVLAKAHEIFERGGERPSAPFALRRTNPAIMARWLDGAQEIAK